MTREPGRCRLYRSMLHPSDTERLEQLEKEFKDLREKYTRLLDYLGLDEDVKERPTLPAPPPGSDPPTRDPWMDAPWTPEEQALIEAAYKTPGTPW